jgi:hypothetical protein
VRDRGGTHRIPVGQLGVPGDNPPDHPPKTRVDLPDNARNDSSNSGEQDWLLEVQTRWGRHSADAGLLLSPCVLQMYTTSEIAANIALETPGLDTLDVLVLWKGFPTYASRQTIFTILKADWFHLVNNEYAVWDRTPAP